MLNNSLLFQEEPVLPPPPGPVLTDNRLLAAHHLVHALAAHHQVLVPVPAVLRHELVSAHSVAVHCQNLSHAASQEHADFEQTKVRLP